MHGHHAGADLLGEAPHPQPVPGRHGPVHDLVANGLEGLSTGTGTPPAPTWLGVIDPLEAILDPTNAFALPGEQLEDIVDEPTRPPAAAGWLVAFLRVVE